MNLDHRFSQQQFANGYELVDGVQMHAENGENFQIPPDVIKRNVGVGHFVELRIDSPRFSVHEDANEKCSCPNCNGDMSKPILRHEHPATLVSIPDQGIPSRGWGEDFWVRVIERSADILVGVVDNRLCETRLHEVEFGNEVLFKENHILAVHNIHRQDLVLSMNPMDLKEFAQWLGKNNRSE